MKSFSTLVVSAAAIVGLSSMVSAIKIDTPMSVVECQPVALTWHEGSTTGFVYISAVPGMDITATPLVQFAPQPAAATGTLTWPQVNVTAGTTFTLVVNDAVGQPNYSSQVTVQKGNSQCSAVSGGAAGSAAAGSATTPSTGAAGSSPATSKAASSGPATTRSSSSAAPASTTGSSSSSSGAAAVSYASPLLAAAALLASVAVSASLL